MFVESPRKKIIVFVSFFSPFFCFFQWLTWDLRYPEKNTKTYQNFVQMLHPSNEAPNSLQHIRRIAARSLVCGENLWIPGSSLVAAREWDILCAVRNMKCLIKYLWHVHVFTASRFRLLLRNISSSSAKIVFDCSTHTASTAERYSHSAACAAPVGCQVQQ